MAFFSKIFGCFCCSSALPQQDFSSDPLIKNSNSPRRPTKQPSQRSISQIPEDVTSSFRSILGPSHLFSSRGAKVRARSEEKLIAHPHLNSISADYGRRISYICEERANLPYMTRERATSLSNFRTCSFCNTSFVEPLDTSSYYPFESNQSLMKQNFFSQEILEDFHISLDDQTAAPCSPQKPPKLSSNIESHFQEEQKEFVSERKYKQLLLSYLPKHHSNRTSFLRINSNENSSQFSRNEGLHMEENTMPKSSFSPQIVKLRASSSVSSLFSNSKLTSSSNGKIKSREDLAKYILVYGKTLPFFKVEQRRASLNLQRVDFNQL